ncbi:DoxX family membrane protein [Brachybacterium sp. JHP9]|uniref:DoxX family membrane protein n=1 Tax=Brachybacterium equifaecis TaxID=2910770 RepID=A0ABT0QYG1_9MICO|nr:DoxX family membrane protein [Brachybacterium equifaecis]MCL6422691.1 DoxX family membrane protein [Brachybacterium equifaecis]
MSLLSRAVLRAVPGAFILNSGIGKIGMDEETAKSLQSMAKNGIPALGDMTPKQFARFLTFGEIAVGSALLLPFVPTRVAGAALAGFSGSMLAMYLKTPGLTEADGVRPTQDGTPIAKDSWMAAIAAALLIDGSRSK